MTTVTSEQVRAQFLDYFVKNHHTKLKSSPLIPANDPTLMFTNAGMVQFKDVFIGKEQRPYHRATTSQKCMRVSGKHNDLEQVGRTARHHTFFEMLGNFSFGDYFKEEAIRLAWEFVTKEVGLDASRLWVTIFGGENSLPPDDEARVLWKRISGLPDARILGMGMKENFWAMGDTGPCGPCTEIHFDQGNDGNPRLEDFESGRVIEIWNNVFMQFERRSDGSLTPLPKPSVDTGMGLERLVAVMSGETSNYHTDLFTPVIQCVSENIGKPYQRRDGDDDISFRVIADHARSTAFLVADGVQPSNEGRGYVLRRIMRRAIRHGKRLGFDDLFFHQACQAVVDNMGRVYPELGEAQALIEKVCQNEEKGFRRTLDTGLRLLSEQISTTRGRGKNILSGEDVFRLYDTYGFPPDLTQVIAEEQGLTVDQDGFEKAMSGQRERSRNSEVGEAAIDNSYKELAATLGQVEFVGYPHENVVITQRPGTWRMREWNGRVFIQVRTRIRAIMLEGAGIAQYILDPTPFYGESGGQVGDHGILEDDKSNVVVVIETKKPVEGLHVCRVQIAKETWQHGQEIWAGYDLTERLQIRAHHSATHLLHAALRQILGEHVKQQGSLVDAQHLRFDYAHFQALTKQEIRKVEDLVNIMAQKNEPAHTEELPFDEAKAKGAMALFGEKYGDRVRMVSMGKSKELCGGTHVQNTSEIGACLLIREEAVASGIRRIEAVAGEAAKIRVREYLELLQVAADSLKERQTDHQQQEHPVLLVIGKAMRQYQASIKQLTKASQQPVQVDLSHVAAPTWPAAWTVEQAQKIRDLWHGLVQMVSIKESEARHIVDELGPVDSEGLLARFFDVLIANRENEKLLEQSARSKLLDTAGDMTASVREINGVKVLTQRIDNADGKSMRELADHLRDKLSSGVLCLGGQTNGKVTLLVAVTSDLTSRFKAGQLIQTLAPLIGGRGGGKPDLAQAGGSDPSGLEKAFSRLYDMVSQT